jgi:methionyl-tRNA synthetase
MPDGGIGLTPFLAARDIGKKNPNLRGDDEGDGEVCEECGRPLEDDDVKPGKQHGKF